MEKKRANSSFEVDFGLLVESFCSTVKGEKCEKNADEMNSVGGMCQIS
jgi:hypothetical protein